MVKLDTVIDSSHIHDCSDHGMLDLIPFLNSLDLGPNDAVLMLEERREPSQADPAVAVDRKA